MLFYFPASQLLVQTLTVTGVTGGTFKLVLQEIYPTADLTFSSTTSAIASALATAANQLADYNVPVECYSFAVTKAVLNGGSGLQLNITFQINNYYQPLSRTVFYTDDLTGTFLFAVGSSEALPVEQGSSSTI